MFTDLSVLSELVGMITSSEWGFAEVSLHVWSVRNGYCLGLSYWFRAILFYQSLRSSLLGHVRALHSSVYRQAWWRYEFSIPKGLDLTTAPKLVLLVCWRWNYCVWLASQIAWHVNQWSIVKREDKRHQAPKLKRAEGRFKGKLVFIMPQRFLSV